VVWQLFLTHSHTHPHLESFFITSKFPSFFHYQDFFSIIDVNFFFRFSSILSSSLWTTGNVSGSVRDPYCCLCPLFWRIGNSYSCSAVTRAVWLWRSFSAFVEEQQKNQTSATAKTKSYLSKTCKNKNISLQNTGMTIRDSCRNTAYVQNVGLFPP